MCPEIALGSALCATPHCEAARFEAPRLRVSAGFMSQIQLGPDTFGNVTGAPDGRALPQADVIPAVREPDRRRRNTFRTLDEYSPPNRFK